MNSSTDGEGDTIKSSFTGCDNLTSICVDNPVWKSIDNGYGADNQIIIDTASGKTIIYGVQGIVNLSNDNISAVDRYALKNHVKLSSVDLPNALSIGNCAF